MNRLPSLCHSFCCLRSRCLSRRMPGLSAERTIAHFIWLSFFLFQFWLRFMPFFPLNVSQYAYNNNGLFFQSATILMSFKFFPSVFDSFTINWLNLFKPKSITIVDYRSWLSIFERILIWKWFANLLISFLVLLNFSS